MNDRYVVSLEYAKKLCELGVKGKSEFVWVDIKQNGEFILYHIHTLECMSSVKINKLKLYPAYLTDEIMEMLPDNTEIFRTCRKQYSIMPNSFATYNTNAILDLRLVDTAAKMLIYLIEQKLISVDEINNVEVKP